MRGIRLRALYLAGAAVVALVLAGSVVGADSITPADQILSLGVGSTYTLNPTLHLDAAPPKADILLAIDTTGSMGTAITEATADANAIVSDIQQGRPGQPGIPGARFAVADFKDYDVGSPGGAFGIPGDYPWRLGQDFTTNGGTAPCAPLVGSLSPIACALGSLTAPSGSGGDGPESYNRAFYEAYSDANLHWASGASRFMIVLGDALPHDATLRSDFPACTDTPPTDLGRDATPGTADDLRTLPTLTTLKQNNTNLSFVTYNPTTATSACHSQLAEFTGGSAVSHGAGTASLENQIVGLINQAASHVDAVNFTVSPEGAPAAAGEWSPSSWVNFDPPLPYGPISAPADVNYQLAISVPQNAVVGQYKFRIHAIADGSERAFQDFTINVTSQGVSALAMTADETSVPAGIAAVPFAGIPAARIPLLLSDPQSAAAGSIPAGSIAAGSIAAGSIPAGSIAAGSIAAGSIAAGSIAAGSIGLGVSAAGSIAAGSIPSGSIAAGSIPVLAKVLLSQIPLVDTTWATILKNTRFETQPLQAVTLEDIALDTVGVLPDNKTPWQRLSALPLRQVPFFTTLWRNVPFAALMLGNAPLSALPPPKKPDGTDYPGATAGDKWQAAIVDNGGSMDGVDPSAATVFGLAVSGKLGSTAVGSIAAGSIASSIAAGSIAAGSIAAGSIAAGSIDLRATSLGPVPLTQVVPVDEVVNCSGGFACTSGKTLGDASGASAIKAGVTLADLLNHLSPARTITIDEIVQAMLPRTDYPWEQIQVQGLQDVAGTGQNVHYHVDFDLVCSVANSVSSVRVTLPDGFFPKQSTSTISYAGGAPITAPDPVSSSNGSVWSGLPGSACGGGTATRHVRLNFTSFAGLTLGTQTSSVQVNAGGTYPPLGNQAPVLVTQNWEPSDDTTAPAIDKNTLIVGHIASAGDKDVYSFPIGTLDPGTKVTAYLKVPRNADLDLAINKPNAPTIQGTAAGSIAAGSIAAGSIPLDDTSPGVDNSRGALPPNTLSDIAAGSIPSGSIAAGSIPAGSISANRNGVNEVAQIVTRGETGNAVIAVSGYNNAFSTGNYVLRLKVTPPPVPLPCTPITGLNSAAAGSLPAVGSLLPTTKALFLVNRQRLVGLYDPTGSARTDALINSSPTSALNAVAAQVGGAVLSVDRDPGVHNANVAWDLKPCSVDAANNVVRAINTLVTSYRATLPNLKYVVLLGTDSALPMWRQADLSSLSPEVDEANDLAFTTTSPTNPNPLTNGNPIYAAAANNMVLTDGAYGAFTRTTWQGHDLPLPQVSVSRLVETPEDILGQLNQFLFTDGQLDLHTALTTGDQFFADGAQAASDALGRQLTLSSNQTLLTPTTLWDRGDLLTNYFNKAGGVPDVGALWAHYSHWVAQPAKLSLPVPVLNDFATTGDVQLSGAGKLLFTVGCHSGLNVPDTLITSPDADQSKRLRDWAQAYSQARSAVYVANTGFGYGDSEIVDLSERLMTNFAQNINSGGTIGEQWVRALHTYYDNPSAYATIDEKVMIEANMYGLPFYGFTGSPVAGPPAPTPPTVHVDSGLDTATLPAITATLQEQPLGDGSGRSLFGDPTHPDGSTYITDGVPPTGGVPLTVGTLSVFYRPTAPLLSRDVTVPGKTARGAFITSLTTHTILNVKPVKPFPLVRAASDAPVTDYPNIFFPAGLVTLNRDVVFGAERDTTVVNMGRFYPNETGDLSKGTEQLVDSIGLDIGYSAPSATDLTPPQITQTGAVETSSGHFTLFVRTTDASGLHRVAVIWNKANNTSAIWNVTPLTQLSGDLWTADITTSGPIVVNSEAQDNFGNVGFSFNKAVNFQSVPDTGGPSFLVSKPLPGDSYTLNQQVRVSFDCSDAGAVTSCTGATTDGGGPISSGGLLDTSKPGLHTFVVTGVDLAGNTTHRDIPYIVRFVFSGFQQPVDNPPVVNIDTAGRTIPVKWGLKDAAGRSYANLNAVTTISSKKITCPSAATDVIETDVQTGYSGLKLVGSDFIFNWTTDKKWAGTCRRLYLQFSDLTLPYADFQLK